MGDGNLLSLCRICLQEGALFSIFNKSDIGESIHTKISLCFKEKVEDIEGFPPNICSSCNTTLETLCNFINKYQQSLKILENGLKTIKKEIYIDDSNNALSEVEIELIKNIKEESDNDLDVSLASLIEPSKIKVKRKKKIKKNPKKKEKKRPKVISQSGNKTSKIASSILEGNFMWTGETWCMKIGDKDVTKKLGKNKSTQNRPKPQIIKIPQKKREPSVKLCDLCGGTFNNQDKLTQHKKKVHTNKNPVQCPECPRVCVSEYSLHRHIKRAHNTSREYICSICGRGFAFKGELTSHHKNVHVKHLAPKKVYSCKFCGKTYKCAKSVIIHERSVHTGQRPAECSICGSCFFHEDYLKEHMRLHTGETPFKCPICGRGYAQRSNMKSHLRIHRISELDAVTMTKIKPNYLKRLKV